MGQSRRAHARFPALPSLMPIGTLFASPAIRAALDATTLPIESSGPDMTRYAIVCSGLLLVILLLAWGFKRFVGTSMRRRAEKRSLAVLDVLPLGGRQKLLVVRCFDRSFLLGIGDKEVNAIAELDAVASEDSDAQELTGLKEDALKAAATTAPFRTQLAESIRAMPRRKPKEQVSEQNDAPEKPVRKTEAAWTGRDGILG